MLTLEEYEFWKKDRLQKILQIYKDYDLESKSYISYSGGLDSTVLSNLFDIILPKNKIPRVFINTGIEYLKTVEFVKKMQKKDERIVIINNDKSVTKILKEKGYPLKAKDFSHKVHALQEGYKSKSLDNFINESWTQIPKKLKPFVIKNDFPFKISDACCYHFKKRIINKWEKENNKEIKITGIRNVEGGNRRTANCIVFNGDKIKAFHPLAPMGNDFIKSFVYYENIEINELYKEPYNFIRTGCRGCPYSLTLQKDLEIMKNLLPTDYYSARAIFGKVYNFYEAVGYRLKI